MTKSPFSSNLCGDNGRADTLEFRVPDRVVAALYKASEQARHEQQENAEKDSAAAAKKLSERLSAEAGAIFLQSITEWLESSDMSAPARTSVIEFLRSH